MSLTTRVFRAGACLAAAASLTMCATAPGPQAQVFERPSVAQPELNDEAEIIQESMAVLEELTSTPDNAIPQYLIDRAAAIVVIPSLLKGGFIVGAEHGKGVMSRRDQATNTWSAPAFVNMSGGSIGWQIGAQSVDVVLLVMNEEGVQQLLEDRFTLGGSLSVTAGPVGRTAEAATDAKMGAQILGYSRARGLFAGAVFEGAALHADNSDIEAFYGERYDLEQVVNGQVQNVPALAQAWKEGLKTLAMAGPPAGAPNTNAGERTENAVEDAAEAASDAIDRAGDAVEDAADKAGDRIDDAQQ
jgi:lipid-binding SYLF domain-containing protein